MHEDDLKILRKAAEGKKSVLEFGPGHSTTAFIDAGCQRIVTAEYNEKYRNKMRERFAAYPQVEVIEFKNVAPVAQLDTDPEFDLAFVDSPIGTPGKYVPLVGQEGLPRFNTMLAALQRSELVYIHDASRHTFPQCLKKLEEMGHEISLIWNKSYKENTFARVVRHGR